MKRILICIVLMLCCFLQTVSAQQPIPVNANAFYQKAMQQINPKHITWIKNTAANSNTKQLDAAGLRAVVSNYGKAGNFSDMDIDALVSLVMMQISKDEEQDLKAQLEAIKKRNEDKKKLRDAMEQLEKNKNTLSRSLADSFHRLAVPKINMVKSNAVNPGRAASTTAATSNVNISATEVKNIQDELKGKLDQISELSETESLRLQMVMERRSKLMEALSNLMKKMSDTASNIIQNLK